MVLRLGPYQIQSVYRERRIVTTRRIEQSAETRKKKAVDDAKLHEAWSQFRAERFASEAST